MYNSFGLHMLANPDKNYLGIKKKKVSFGNNYLDESQIYGNYHYNLYPSPAPNKNLNQSVSFGSNYLDDIGIHGNYQYNFYPSPAPNRNLNQSVSFGKKRKVKRNKSKIVKKSGYGFINKKKGTMGEVYRSRKGGKVVKRFVGTDKLYKGRVYSKGFVYKELKKLGIVRCGYGYNKDGYEVVFKRKGTKKNMFMNGKVNKGRVYKTKPLVKRKKV